MLEVGCGTGRFLAALAGRAKAWGIDPSPEMLEVARGRVHGAGLKLGSAEELPFKDGWFERAAMWLVVHLVERPRAFAELHRVLGPGGRLTIATFDPAHFEEFWLNALFPSLEGIDRARFPTAEQLERELGEAGFAEVRLTRISQQGSIDRAGALERIRGKHISTFDLLDEAEYEAGLTRADREMPERVEYRLEWLIATAEAAVRGPV